MNTENIIEIKKLVKSYKIYGNKQSKLLELLIPKYNNHKEFKALNDIDLEIKKGEVLGVLGENGAGKSTLLKIITGVTYPTAGSLKIDGKVSSLLELGTAFNPELTGEENIYLHGQIMGYSLNEIEEKKQKIINFADIGEYLYQPVKTYSSGMFARLAFACAINVEPDILIVDEVLSVGDIAFQLKCFKKFQEFKDEGKTIIFVTHNINDVIRNCTRTIILSNGRKVFDGDVKSGIEIYKKMMVGIDKENKENDVKKNVNEKLIWKDNYIINKELLSYGNEKAKIIDYGIFNKANQLVTMADNNEDIIIKMKVKFNEDIVNPIFAVSIKDFNGLELIGINTDERKVETGEYKKGDEVIIEFKQKIPLAPNKYTISFGCTKYSKNEKLEVFDRKYDALFLEIISNKTTIGLIEIDSEIYVKR